MSRRTRLVAKAVIAIWLTSFFIGYYLGRAWSPDFENASYGPQLVRDYVVEHADVTSFDARRVELPGRPPLVEISPTSFAYGCEIQSFVFNSSGLARSVTLSRAERPVWAGRNGLEFESAVTLLVSGTGAYAVTETIPAFGRVFDALSHVERIRLVVYGAVAAVSGMAIGFWAGYRKGPRCGNSIFVETVTNRESASAIFLKLQHTYRLYVGIPALRSAQQIRQIASHDGVLLRNAERWRVSSDPDIAAALKASPDDQPLLDSGPELPTAYGDLEIKVRVLVSRLLKADVMAQRAGTSKR